MNNKKLGFSLAVAITLLSGCSTQAIRTTDAEEVPAQRVLNATYIKQTKNTQFIVVKRDSGNKGLFCTSRLSVDGVAVADLKTTEKVGLYLPYGNHMLSVNLLGLSIMCGKMNAETEAYVESGKKDEYRIGVTSNAELFIKKTGFK